MPTCVQEGGYSEWKRRLKDPHIREVVINEINILTSKKPRLFRRSLQKADVIKTHGSNKKILKKVGKINFRR